MSLLLLVFAGVASASLLSWLYLLLARGFYWRTSISLATHVTKQSRKWPSVSTIVPARDEAAVLAKTLPTLLTQEYHGQLRVYLVDDQSSDSTASVAHRLAERSGSPGMLKVIDGSPLPSGWAGKVWAMEQGVRAAGRHRPDYLWFTDADIAHHPQILQALVLKAESDNTPLVSLAAQLHCRGFWERLLVPAFIYFFAKLFPFRWVNDSHNPTAAAAGGCMLVHRKSLELASGLANIADSIIDDCALASLIKGRRRDTKICLGLSHDVMSVRPYSGLWPLWGMVARTAYTQLRYSPAMLLGTVAGMTLVYIVPPAGLTCGLLALWSTGEWRL